MSNDQILNEIREANLTYLMLAQTLIRQDKVVAQTQLALSEEAACMLEVLSPAQVLKIASGPMLLCRFRVDDDMVWNLLTNHHTNKVNNVTADQFTAEVSITSKISETT